MFEKALEFVRLVVVPNKRNSVVSGMVNGSIDSFLSIVLAVINILQLLFGILICGWAATGWFLEGHKK